MIGKEKLYAQAHGNIYGRKRGFFLTCFSKANTFQAATVLIICLQQNKDDVVSSQRTNSVLDSSFDSSVSLLLLLLALMQ